jgi:hypothetical protein
MCLDLGLLLRAQVLHRRMARLSWVAVEMLLGSLWYAWVLLQLVRMLWIRGHHDCDWCTASWPLEEKGGWKSTPQ